MQKNDWVIIGKEPIPGKKRPEFNYTIIPVNAESGLYDGAGDTNDWSVCIPSLRNLAIGTHTDDELRPLSEVYKGRNTDIATIDSTQISPHQPDSIRISVFGQRFGELYFLIDPDHPVLKIRRGDCIMLQRMYICPNSHKVYDEYDDEDDEYENTSKPFLPWNIPIFHPLYNLTTKQMSKYFQTTEDQLDDFDNVVVLSMNPTEGSNYTIQKHLFMNSKKFKRHISFLVQEYEPEFRSEPDDKILLEKYWDKNTGCFKYRILSNLTLNAMRNQILTNKK